MPKISLTFPLSNKEIGNLLWVVQTFVSKGHRTFCVRMFGFIHDLDWLEKNGFIEFMPHPPGEEPFKHMTKYIYITYAGKAWIDEFSETLDALKKL